MIFNQSTIIQGNCMDMSLIEDSSIQLIITSPPYWNIKDYGHSDQIGFYDSYEEYHNKLNKVWSECHRVLENGCRLCINVGDVFTKTADFGRHKIIPVRTKIIEYCESIGFDYMGAIIWHKLTNKNTSGGASVMGSYPYPRNGLIDVNYEFILLFKKLGKTKFKPSAEIKEKSKLTKEEWKEYFSGYWTFPGVKQKNHVAMFPEELPTRLIKMFSFVNDRVLDPFSGSGTTVKMADRLNRIGIGYELNPDYVELCKNKIGLNLNVIVTNQK